MKILLAYPPLDDPTLPYHATAYLAGHLVHSGFADVVIRDVNVEMVNWVLEEENVAAFYEEAARRLSALERHSALSFAEQEEYLALWRQRRVSYDDLRRAAAGMRDRHSFFSFPDYQRYRSDLCAYMETLSALSYPGELTHFRLSNRGRFSPYNLRDLFDPDLGARICQVFDRFLAGRLAADVQFAAADCIGISVAYDHQLFHALHLARWLKQVWPAKQVLFGGTSISQNYKYMKNKERMADFFAVCDGIVVGEGETALCEIADAGGVVPGARVQNLITFDKRSGKLFLPQHIHYENVHELGRPLYRYPWELYLAPERGINYSPTRGCYWNRCTFCDYGLNTSKPTSPWRERGIDQVIEDLAHTVRETRARYVYFAVDVMSPAYLDRMTDAIVEAGLDIRWGAELRMEKVFSAERCKKLAQSGCVCVSFGMESGNQRVLDLIDKGTKVAFMGETMKNFAGAGVAVQLMTFSGFPSETAAEKEETLRFIQEHDEFWSAGGMGTFQLTGSAIVARDPARFGLRLLDRQDADIERAPGYEREGAAADEVEPRAFLAEERDASFEDRAGVFPALLGRPWAGGTDSLHSMIYYDHYGRRFFRDLRQTPDAGTQVADAGLRGCVVEPRGVVRDSSFDLAKIISERQSLASYLRELDKTPREPTLRSFQEWAEARPKLAPGRQRRYWSMAGAKCICLDPLVYRLLAESPQPLVLGDLLRGVEIPQAEKLVRYLKGLASHGLITLRQQASPIQSALPK
jgi:hypothetical protein